MNTTFRSQVLVVAAVITAALCLNAENLILVKQSCSGRHCVSLRGRMKRIAKTRVEKSGTLDEGQDPISPTHPIPRSRIPAPPPTLESGATQLSFATVGYRCMNLVWTEVHPGEFVSEQRRDAEFSRFLYCYPFTLSWKTHGIKVPH